MRCRRNAGGLCLCRTACLPLFRRRKRAPGVTAHRSLAAGLVRLVVHPTGLLPPLPSIHRCARRRRAPRAGSASGRWLGRRWAKSRVGGWVGGQGRWAREAGSYEGSPTAAAAATAAAVACAAAAATGAAVASAAAAATAGVLMSMPPRRVLPPAGLTEAEQAEGEAAAAAAQEEAGSDDDGDYKQASKVGAPQQ